MKKHHTVKLFCLLAAFGLLSSTASAQILEQSAKYSECTRQVGSNARAALGFADDWMLRENAPSAQHCRSLALFSLKRYRDAALELERLSERITRDNAVLWVNILRQASQAWQLADQRHRAIAALTRAILVTSVRAQENNSLAILTTELLLERSALYIYDGKTLDAIQDLDNSIALQPKNTRLRLARAKLFIAMKEKALAKEDLTMVLAQSPNNQEAKTLLAKL